MVNIYYGNWDTCNKAEVNAEPATGSVEPFVNTAASLSWRQEANGAENKQNDEARDDGKPPELRPGSVDSNASSPAPGPAANVACSNPATPVIFDDFVKSLDQTCWMNIVKSYYDKDGNFLSNRVQFVSSMKVPTSDSCYQVLAPLHSSSIAWPGIRLRVSSTCPAQHNTCPSRGGEGGWLRECWLTRVRGVPRCKCRAH